MSQQLVLDISDATARSKGQARRRFHPTLSEDARKEQRNLARRERARCKKTRNTEQQLLSSERPVPHADRPQYISSIPIKGKAGPEISEVPLLPHLPAFMVLPVRGNNVNLRALAQSNRYIAAQSKAQKAKDILQGDVQHIGDIDIIQAPDRFDTRIAPAEQDLDTARGPVENAKEQHPILTGADTENTLVNPSGESDVNASMEYSRRCPVTSCEYHHKKFELKGERDQHTSTHFQGLIKCGFYHYRSSIFFFNNVEHLIKHMHEHHNHDFNGFSDLRDFQDFGGFIKHLGDCILNLVELEASGKARPCPVPTCEYHHRLFPSKFEKGQHMIQHYRRSLDCYWSYQDKTFYSLDAFRGHASKKHWLGLTPEVCPLCFRASPNEKELLEHLDSCVILEVGNRRNADTEAY